MLPDSWDKLIQPELLALIPALNFAAMLMKKRGTDATKIPMRLGLGSIVLAVCYELATTPVTSLPDLCGIGFSGVTQGLLCAAGAVYLHQLKHQREKADAEHAPQALKGAKKAPGEPGEDAAKGVEPPCPSRPVRH